MRSPCSSHRHSWFGATVVLALWVGQAGTALSTDDIAGLYHHEGAIAATLEVVREADQYVVRLEGGVPSGGGPATPADCVVEARGVLHGAVLRARFGPVDTDTFFYGAGTAEREGRIAQIAFEPGFADVLKVDILGYCALMSEFSGRYRKVEEPPGE
jgi:hypothetical protein